MNNKYLTAYLINNKGINEIFKFILKNYIFCSSPPSPKKVYNNKCQSKCYNKDINKGKPEMKYCT